MPTGRQFAIVVSVLGLVAANLAILTAFIAAMEDAVVGAQWFDQVGIGLLLGNSHLSAYGSDWATGAGIRGCRFPSH
jgi:hypothetical protein